MTEGERPTPVLKSPGQPQCNARFCLRFSVTFINCYRHLRGHTKWLPLAHKVTET
jgi:hypothetical protein